MTKDIYKLLFVRSRDGRESDFLIEKNFVPWLLLEANTSHADISPHHYAHAKILGNIPFVQLVREENIMRVAETQMYAISASKFFG